MSFEARSLGACPTCKREIEIIDEFETRWCSGFCADTNEAEKQAFLAAKPGDYCMYPCPGCGTTMEDVWEPETPKMSQCRECAEKKRDILLREALENSRVMLLLCRGTVAMNSMPGVEVVLQNIDEALKY